MAVLYKTAQSILANKDLSKGDTKNVIGNLVRVLTTHLQSSESVTLDGFGTFRMTVRFLPCYTKNPDRTVATRSMVTGVKCIPYGTGQAGGNGGGNGNGDSGGNGGHRGRSARLKIQHKARTHN